MAEEEGSYVLYRYDPSIAAAIIFTILFSIVTSTQLYQMIRTRLWIFIPFVLGGCCQWIGYTGRIISAAQSPDWTLGPYIVQTLLLLIAPALYAASIYMMLGRLVLVTGGEKHSIIPKRWLTKIFVAGDVASFLLQGAGGGIMSGGKPKGVKTGERMIIGGLVVQLLFFGCFIITSATFHVRIRQRPTDRIFDDSLPWERQLYALYGSSVLILIRSVFRLIEYVQGNDGYLISHEVYLYVFDSVLMLATMVLLTWIHPSEITAHLRGSNGKAVRRVLSVYPLV